MFKLNNNKDYLINIYFLFYSICLLYKFLNFLLNKSYWRNQWNYWDVSEWLINYQGGFVRRGIKGQILYFLNEYLSLDIYLVINVVSGLSFILLTVLIARGFIRKGYTLFILPLGFFLGNCLINGVLLKIENLLFLIFITIIYIIVHKPRYYLLWVNLLSIFSLLNHESFLFYSFPIIFLLVHFNLYKDNITFKSYFNTLLCLLPIVVIFIFLVYYNGSDFVANSIWKSWSHVNLAAINPKLDKANAPYGIAALGYSFNDGVLLVLGQFMRVFNHGIYGVFMLALSIVIVYYITSNLNRLNNPICGIKPKDIDHKSEISAVLILQFLTVSILFIIGVDYSRWVSYWVISSFSIILFVPHKTLMQIIPNFIVYLSKKTNIFLYNTFGNSKSTLILLSIVYGLPFAGWTLVGAIESSSLYIVISAISKILKFILNHILHVASFEDVDLVLFFD